MQEPPAAWPFLPDQKIEFVHRDDAVNAIVDGTDAELTDATRVINGFGITHSDIVISRVFEQSIAA
ncbi:MAG TPA: hypothetical protein DHV68_06520, partial [Dehalococcoidia bacterium]|nr:hypothetical protein [Dehalococcoidia bacterium]